MKPLLVFISLLFISQLSFAQGYAPDSTAAIQSEQLYTIPSREDLSVKGQIDAEMSYKRYKGASRGTLITSLVSPILGLVPAIISSTTTPTLENLGYPNKALFMQAEYHDAYTHKAKKIKQRHVWKNWGIGLGVNVLLLVIISTGQR